MLLHMYGTWQIVMKWNGSLYWKTHLATVVSHQNQSTIFVNNFSQQHYESALTVCRNDCCPPLTI